MKYKCTDHLDKFYFRDACMEKCEFNSGLMTWQVSGIVARYHNPANETLVDRYMDTADVRFKNPVIRRFVLEGAKLYNADDVLVEEIPDTVIPEAEYESLFRRFSGGILFAVLPKDPVGEGRQVCEFAVDLENEEEETTETYWVEVEYDKVLFEWDRFLNKAMLE